MKVDQLLNEVVAEQVAAAAPELTHDWCCDPNRGLCGADLTDGHTCPDDLSCGCDPCVVCEDLLDADCAVTCSTVAAS